MIAAYWRGEVSLRKVRVFVENLPPGSALGRAAVKHSWRDTEFLLAEIGDRLGLLLELTRVANSENESFRTPELLPRPGDAERKAREEKEFQRARAVMDRDLAQLLPGG